MVFCFTCLMVLLQASDSAQLIINEILFNPSPGGYDYVEGYNRSDHSVDLSLIRLANRNSVSEVANLKVISRQPVYLAPHSYFVMTSNKTLLRQHYKVPDTALVFELSTLPSFPDDAGDVIFCTADSSVIDEVRYEVDWQLALIDNPQGVALERIDPGWPSGDRNSWTSGASSAGYGTPGGANSARASPVSPNKEVTMKSLFSPDNNGVDDIELLYLSPPGAGYIANAYAYDMSGRRVRTIIRNESLGSHAVYQWDGLDDRSLAAPAGMYIIVTQIFNLTGDSRTFKNAVALIRR